MMKSMNSGTPASVALPGAFVLRDDDVDQHADGGVFVGGEELRLERRACRLRRRLGRLARARGPAAPPLRVHENPAAAGAAGDDAQDRASFRVHVAPGLSSSFQLPAASCQLPATRFLLSAPNSVASASQLAAGSWKRQLNRSRLSLIRDEFRRPHRERQDRPRAVLVGLRHERSAVGDEHVPRVVRLAVLVQDRGRRIVPHPRDADLMDDASARRDAVALLRRRHR